MDLMLKSLPPERSPRRGSTACGNSLPAQLLQTSCGTATRSLEGLLAAKHCKLPTVIITGGHGHGKFYTLESLVKKRLFPRESSFRIHVAIRLRLRRVAERAQHTVTLTCPCSTPRVLPLESSLPDELAQAFEHLQNVDSMPGSEITIEICQVKASL